MDAESAGLALLATLFAVAVSIGLLVHWFANARYAAATGLLIGLGGVTGVCARDYRRGRWSVVSGLAFGVRLLAIVAALAYAAWIDWHMPYANSNAQPLFP